MAGFNISDFKAHISVKGVLRPNKFLCNFSIPIILQGKADFLSTNRYMEYWIESSTIPGISFASYDNRRYGYGSSEKRVFAPQFQDVTCSIISDGYADNWTFFATWMSSIIQVDGRRGINETVNLSRAPITTTSIQSKLYEITYKQDYVSDVTIIQFNDMGDPVQEIVLRDAYPIMLGDYNTSWADTNTIVKFPIVFTYTDWYNNSIKSTNTIPPIPIL